jgi:Nuclease A inhibitor-like protein
MTEHNIEIPCNTEVLIRVTCKEAQPIPVIEPLPPEPSPIIEPVITVEPINIPVESEPIPVIEPIPPKPVEPELIPLPPIPEPLPPVLIPDPVPPVQPTSDPIVLPLPDSVPPISTPEPLPVPTQPLPPEHCYCDLDSPLSLPDFVKQLNALTKGLLYPSESDFPIEVLTKGFSSKMPPLRGIQVRTLDRVLPSFLRNIDPDDQQTGNVERASLATRWQALYQFIKVNASVTAWHYPVKGKKYTHELFVLLLHPQGTVSLRTKLVET